jgi:hypothetical protein
MFGVGAPGTAADGDFHFATYSSPTWTDRLIIAASDGTSKLKGNLWPATDNTYYLGKNDDDTPFAWKGLIVKDTTNGNYYRIEVTNGAVAVTQV